jgi:hypothetical protein
MERRFPPDLAFNTPRIPPGIQDGCPTKSVATIVATIVAEGGPSPVPAGFDWFEKGLRMAPFRMDLARRMLQGTYVRDPWCVSARRTW